MIALPPRDVRRIVAAAGLMSSSQDGEALAALRATCRLLQPYGLQPSELISVALSPPRIEAPRLARKPDPFTQSRYSPSMPHQGTAQMCLFQSVYLNEWEKGFLESIKAERSLSTRQREKLDAIVAKIDAKMKEASDERG